jgi:Flp pilus assembly CpaF family ATPase
VEAFRRLLGAVRDDVGALLEERGRLAPGADDDDTIRALIDARVAAEQRRAAALNVPGPGDGARLAARLFDHVRGSGPLEALLRDPEVEEVVINGPRVFAFRRGRKALVQELYFETEAEVMELLRRLLGPLGKRLDEASPIVDAALPGGARLHAVIPPAAVRWCHVNIRKHLLAARSLDELVALGALPAEAAAFLRACVRARVSIVVSGAGGSGKCVTGDTLVTLGDGRLAPIGALVERVLAAGAASETPDGWTTAPLGEAVLTCDFAARRIRPATGVTAWRHRAPGTLIEVHTRTGRSVRVTPEHPFFTVVDGEIVQIRADRLVPGARIAVANTVPAGGVLPDLLELLSAQPGLHVPEAVRLVGEALSRIMAREGLPTMKATYARVGLPPRARTWHAERHSRTVPLPVLVAVLRHAGMGDDRLGPALTIRGKRGRAVTLARRPVPAMARLAGLVAGDGHLARSYVELTSGDPAVRQSFVDLCLELFGHRPNLRPDRSASRCPTLVLSSFAASAVLSRAYGIPFGAKARSVRAPDWLFAAPHAQVAAYLSGLLDTDGSVVPRKQGRTAVVEFCTTSVGLAQDVAALLLRLSVAGHLDHRPSCCFVRVYRPEDVRRLGRLLPVVHSRRSPALRCGAAVGTYSSVDVIPGLATRLLGARLAGGFTMRALGGQLGVSRAIVAAYERGEHCPPRGRVAVAAGQVTDKRLASTLADLAAQPVFWDRVVAADSVSAHGETYVYDLTVPDTHTFLAGPGGVVAHNTTFVRALAAEIDSDQERLVCCEDTPELRLDEVLPDVVALQARPPNAEGEGEITIRQLVRASLRMRPTRIIVGESRGPEALDVLTALNTGHEGGLTTIHANSPRQALHKLITMAAAGPERLGIPAATRMVVQTVELVCFLEEDRRTQRRAVTHIAELANQEGEVLLMNDLWTRTPPGAADTAGPPDPDGRPAPAGRLGWTGIVPRCLDKIRRHGVPYALPPAPGEARSVGPGGAGGVGASG